MNHIYSECEMYLAGASGKRLSESKHVGLRIRSDGRFDIDAPTLKFEVLEVGLADRLVFQITAGVLITVLLAEISVPTATIGQTVTIESPKV